MRKVNIEKVAVLGAGVMGQGIAAHLANAGIHSVLLDIVPWDLKEEEKENPQARSRIAISAIENLKKVKPALLLVDRFAELIQPGNIEDDLSLLSDCDWIVEAVVENLDIKRNLFQKILPFRKYGTIVTSNTSGISLEQLVEGFPEDFRRNFFVTHFFNPVRYMKLLEIVVGKDTDPEVVDSFVDFGKFVLGKGIVFGKDTPNFIANRIGVYGMMKAIQVMMEDGLTVEEIDAIAGPPMGRPKSAAFKTCDLVGLDTFAHVAKNVYDNLPDDDERDVFLMPTFINRMIENRWLGNKTKKGFYTRDEKGEWLFIDYNTLEYRSATKLQFDSVKATKGIDNAGERIKILLNGEDKAAKFAWKVTANSLIYTAKRIGEIADDIVNIDNAMKWGYNWDLGPFEVWDAIGVAESVARMEVEGMKVPDRVKRVLTEGKGSFYIKEGGERKFFDFVSGTYKTIEKEPTIIILPDLKDEGKVISENFGATLYDIGDGVACLEFHTKMNAIDEDIITMISDSVDAVERNFEGLVVSGHAENFSVGANLGLILMAAQMGNWSMLEDVVRKFQKANLKMKYSKKPVVVAPFGMALGGGCEVVLHAARIQAYCELYMGLVEVGAGVIPAAGGCTQTLVRCLENIPANVETSRIPFIRRAFEMIGLAKVSFSAEEARQMGYLRDHDNVSLSRDNLINDAKNLALSLSKNGYKRPLPPDNLLLPGKNGAALLRLGLYSWRLGGMISEHDELIGQKLANVLCGGDCNPKKPVTEQHILDLETEAFLSLCGYEKTQARMKSLLETGRPLRN